jgi:hypothetical protein
MEENNSKLDQLCDNLDELTLKQVDYLDETLTLMSKLENHLTNGFIDLAKSRYISGERTVSTMQIPGEESDIEPTTTIIRNEENKLMISRNKEANDPLKWFGVLVPTSLRQSQSAFKQVLETAVEILNARNEWLNALEEAKTLSAEKNSS